MGRLRGFRAEYGPLSIAPRSDSSEIQRFLGAIVLLPSRIDGVGVFAVRDLSAEAVLYDSDCMSDSQALLPRAMMNDACMPDFAAIHSPGSAMSVMDAYTLRSEAACNILVEHPANSTGERFALAIGPGGTGAALPLRTRVTVTRAIPKGGELLRSYSAEHWLETMTAFSAVLPEYRAQVEMVQVRKDVGVLGEGGARQLGRTHAIR